MHVKAVKLAGVHEVMGGQGHDSVSERCSDAPICQATPVTATSAPHLRTNRRR
jgi:hypothetical protein